MYNLTYEETQAIEENAIDKLLDYINKEENIENIINNIDFLYPNIGEKKEKIAFDLWFSIDYRDENNMSFIDKFLLEKNKNLTILEKEILIERNKSSLSLFQINKVEGKKLHVVDKLLHKKQKLYNPSLSMIVKKGDLIFGRVGKVLDRRSFVGDINYLPQLVRDDFIEEVFIDFNRTRYDYPNLKMENYLKEKSINLYSIYADCVDQVMDMDSDMTSHLYAEINEFEGYMDFKKIPTVRSKRFISNLIDIFEYYLVDRSESLKDLGSMDFESFFSKAIDDNFISTQEELNSYIRTLKTYLRFLKNKTGKNKENFKRLLDISKNRFSYIGRLKYIQSPFNINKNLSANIFHLLNDQAVSLVMDFDKFILFSIDRPPELTEKKKHIKRSFLIQINELLEEELSLKKKAPNQKNFPIIDLFYKMSIQLGLLIIRNDRLVITKKGSNYLRLKDEEKYSLFFDYIWSHEFLSSLFPSAPKWDLDRFKEKIIGFFLNLKEDVYCSLDEVLDFFKRDSKFFLTYFDYLEFLGLVHYREKAQKNMKLTVFGKMIFKFMAEQKNEKDRSNLIDLQSFRDRNSF